VPLFPPLFFVSFVFLVQIGSVGWVLRDGRVLTLSVARYGRLVDDDRAIIGYAGP